jgi:fused signal recognition particle receptor
MTALRWLILANTLLSLLKNGAAFAPPRNDRHAHLTSTSLPMVFQNFLKKTGQQLSEVAQASYEGRLGEGFFNGLAKSRTMLKQNLELLLTGKSDDMMEDLLDILLQADLGMATSEDVVNEVKSLAAIGQRLKTREDLMSVMRGKIIEALDTDKSGLIQFSEQEGTPTVLFIMGANGMGKTTTIGKIAHRLRTEGNQTVLMAACDTFRAGAVEQLQLWADRAGVECFTPTEAASTPAAVLYGALDMAMAGKYDTLLVDTSGRLSNNDALTAELAKMKRVIQKRLSVENDAEGRPVPNLSVPHETLLVIDAAQGRMALDSAKVWDKQIGLTGLILTKLDGSARGGSVVAVSRELALPVKLIGVGEGIADLQDVSFGGGTRFGHCGFDRERSLTISFCVFSFSAMFLWMVC